MGEDRVPPFMPPAGYETERVRLTKRIELAPWQKRLAQEIGSGHQVISTDYTRQPLEIRRAILLLAAELLRVADSQAVEIETAQEVWKPVEWRAAEDGAAFPDPDPEPAALAAGVADED